MINATDLVNYQTALPWNEETIKIPKFQMIELCRDENDKIYPFLCDTVTAIEIVEK